MLVMSVYTLLAFLSLLVFGLLHVWGGNNFLGRLELAGAMAVGLNAVGLRLHRNVATARMFLLLAIIVMLFVMFTTGGTHATGIFWFFMFPVMAFFLAGKRQGLWWMAGLYAMLLGAVVLVRLDILSTPYAMVTIRQLLVTLGVVTVGIYVYQGTRETAESQMEGIDRTKSDFVALASHQLRTPVSAIAWFAEMLLNGDTGTLTQEQHKTIEQIYKSNQRMNDLISDMLIVSSLAVGSLPVKPVQTNITTLSSAILKDAKDSLLVGRILTITEQYAAHLPKIPVDQDIMRTILQNLISNAIKYTPDNGTISLHITRTREQLHPDSQGSLRIAIEDSGYGIPKDAEAKIFTKFFRADNIKPKDTDGTGLGLYTVSMLLDYVGGSMNFVSKENVGSTFVVLLPLEGMKRTEARP